MLNIDNITIQAELSSSKKGNKNIPIIIPAKMRRAGISWMVIMMK